MVNGDYSFLLCPKREGFQAILDTILFRNQHMMVVVVSETSLLVMPLARTSGQTCCRKTGEKQEDAEGAQEQPAQETKENSVE